MSHYRNGRDFEHKVRKALREDGYDVLRSAGSKTKVDLLAVKPGQVLAIQCKRNGKCPPSERLELLRLAGMIPGALALVAGKPPRRPIAYRLLTGPGPKDWQPWTPDEIEEAS